MPLIGEVKAILLHLPVRWIKELDQLVNEGKYGSRSQAIRVAVRDLLADEVWTRRT